MSFVALSVFLCSLLAAQSVAPIHRGEVTGGDPNGYLEGRLQVEVYDSSSHMVVDRVPVAPNGSFEFRAQPQSSSGFDLRVVNQRGDVLRQERFLSHLGNSVPLRLSLTTTRRAERPAEGMVSVGRLRHRPSKKAVKEFERAEKAVARKDLETAVSHLRTAIRIDPEFMEAYNSMGNRLLQLKRLPEAADAFAQAIRIDPGDSKPYSNLAIVQLHLGQGAEAERTARQASRMQRDSRHADYLIGLALLAQKKNLAEALSLLERSADELPHARMAAAQILVIDGRLPDAQRQLEKYLDGQPAAQHRAVAEKWLSQLRAYNQGAVSH